MIKNLTPHPATILNQDESLLIEIRSSGLARLAQETTPCEPIACEGCSIPTSKSLFGKPTGLPDEEEGVFLIVSQMIKSALPDRKDLLVPAETVRDPAGAILGCKSLGR